LKTEQIKKLLLVLESLSSQLFFYISNEIRYPCLAFDLGYDQMIIIVSKPIDGMQSISSEEAFEKLVKIQEESFAARRIRLQLKE